MFRTRNKHLPLITTTFGILLSILMCTAHAGDPEKAVYDKGFGEKDAAVRASRSPRKIAEFAGELLESAKLVREDQPYQAYLFNKSYEIGMLFPEGIPFAVEAMDQLGKAQPQLKGAADANLLNAMQKRYLTSGGSPRTAAASAYIDRALQIADALAAEGKYDEAVIICDKAKIALAASAARHNDVLERALMFKEEQAAARRIAALKAALKTTPHDAVAAGELVRLLMLDSDTPDQALPYVDATGDAKLKKIVALAAKDVATLTDGESLELADWFHGQTIKAGKLASYTAWTRAKACYQHFLDVHPHSDADRLNAGRAIKDAETALAKLPAVRNARPASVASSTPPGPASVDAHPVPPVALPAASRPIVPSSVQPQADVAAYLQRLGIEPVAVAWPYAPAGPRYKFQKPIATSDWSQLLATLNGTVAVVFVGGSGTDDAVAQIAKLPTLRYLDLSKQPVTNEGIAFLSDHRSLQVIVLSGTGVTGECVRYLGTIHALTNVVVRSAAIRGRVLKPLMQCRTLAVLDVFGNQLHDEDIAELAGHPALEELSIGQTKITSACADSLLQMPSLRSVVFFETGFDDEGVTKLSKDSTIELLNVSRCQLGHAAFEALPQYKHLKILSLENHREFSDADMANLVRCEHLEDLDVSGGLSGFGDAAIAYVSKMRNLKRLDMRGTRVTDKGLELVLRSVPGLRLVTTGGSAVTDAAFEELKRRYSNVVFIK